MPGNGEREVALQMVHFVQRLGLRISYSPPFGQPDVVIIEPCSS